MAKNKHVQKHNNNKKYATLHQIHKNLSREDYHRVPTQWHAEDIVYLHRRLNGTFPIKDRLTAYQQTLTNWHRSDQNRYLYASFMSAINLVDEGVKSGDPACIEISIQFIEARIIRYYTGHFRSKLARRLKAVELSPYQKDRLNKHFYSLVFHRDYSQEFREYRALWAKIIDEEHLSALENLAAHNKCLLPEGKNKDLISYLKQALQARSLKV